KLNMKRRFTLLMLSVLFLCWIGWPVLTQANPPDPDEMVSDRESARSATKIQETALTVEGVVVDQNGDPLIGVNVLVKETTKGTSTDFDGRFSLDDVDEDAILVFSYIGYETLEVPVDGKSSLTITMTSDSQMLDEVVVTALGIKKEKKALGYAVQDIGSEELMKNKNTNLVNSLSGK